MGSISCHITPLVINSLRVDTHTHTDDTHRINFKKPGAHLYISNKTNTSVVKVGVV